MRARARLTLRGFYAFGVSWAAPVYVFEWLRRWLIGLRLLALNALQSFVD